MSRPARLCACGAHVWAHLSRGYVTIVSPEDASHLVDQSWHAMITRGGHVYARRSGKKTARIPETLLLHRVILSPLAGMVADHASRNTLDNTRDNLRVASREENNRNRIGNRKGHFKGVSLDPRSGLFSARIAGRFIGSFATASDAAHAYDAAAIEAWGEFARPNFLPSSAVPRPTPTPEKGEREALREEARS